MNPGPNQERRRRFRPNGEGDTPARSCGWLREQAEQDRITRVGRPALSLEQVPEAFTVMGVRLGYESAQIGLADARSRLKAPTELRIDTSTHPPTSSAR